MQVEEVKKLIELFKSCNFTRSAEALEELLNTNVCVLCVKVDD